MHTNFRSVFLSMALTAALVVGTMASAGSALAGRDSLITKTSTRSFEETVETFKATLDARGLTTFAVIDHAAGAETAGAELRPTTVLIFGNPKLGTPLMAAAQTAGLDLPLKAVVYEDEAGAVHISYWDPAAIAKRHGASKRLEVVGKMQKGLDGLTNDAAGIE